MLPFTLNGTKLKTDEELDAKDYTEQLARTIRHRGLELDIRGNTIDLTGSLKLSKLGNIHGTSVIGILTSCSISVEKRNSDILLKYRISFLPLLSLSMIFLPFILISFMNVSPSLSIPKDIPITLASIYIGGGYLICLIRYIALLKAL